MIVFADTNVILDVLQKRHPQYEYSSQVWNLIEHRSAVGYVSAISFNNAFYLLRKSVGFELALGGMKAMRTVFKTVALDDAILDSAIGSGAADFEDSIQSASAIRIRADCIVTRNIRDFTHYRGRVVTPEELIAVFTKS
jgi:predicted nucleic acid-binding protein